MRDNITAQKILYDKKKLMNYMKRCERFTRLSSKYDDVEIAENEDVIVMEELDCTIRRIFNNNCVNDGGRFYGADYQRLSREERSKIVINFEKTAELDYSALHIRMLYHKKGIDYKEDPYSLPGYSEEFRPLIKKAVNIIINARSIVQAKESLRKTIKEIDLPIEIIRPSRFCNNLIREIEHYHQAIKEYFYSGYGLKLQRYDSDIALDIMKELTEKNILVLIVHDSFLVQEYYVSDLKDAMIRHYKVKFNFDPVIKS
ncbi:MAG: hypothetical protein QXU40_02750 [Candidatus Pacearchaeota archaeon]